MSCFFYMKYIVKDMMVKYTVLNTTSQYQYHENCHLYNYAGNNPISYTDPDGRVIKITITCGKTIFGEKTKTYQWDNKKNLFVDENNNPVENNDFINKITDCLLYLKKSSIAEHMIKDLSESKKNITIKSKKHSNRANIVGKNIEILFDINFMLKLNDGTESQNSVALNLGHELVHAFDHIILENYKKNLNDTNVPFEFLNKAEFIAIFATDLFAIQLGEALRFDYISARPIGKGSCTVSDFINNQQ